jgi:arylsulfatase A-like enzyme
VDELYRRRIQSLQSVDDSVAQLVATLGRSGQLRNTYVVFTSDNGYHLGEHRLPAGKQTAYEEDINVPLIVRGPAVPAGRTHPELVGNPDLAPTFAALAGVSPPPFVDGRSLLPLLRTGPVPNRWRQAFLVEHWGEVPTAGQQLARRGAPLEPADEDQEIDETSVPPHGAAHLGVSAATHDPSPEFHAIRTERYLYVEYVTGERELYDLQLDPYELKNIAADAPHALTDQLHQRVDALQTCRAAACRDIEGHPLS